MNTDKIADAIQDKCLTLLAESADGVRPSNVAEQLLNDPLFEPRDKHSVEKITKVIGDTLQHLTGFAWSDLPVEWQARFGFITMPNFPDNIPIALAIADDHGGSVFYKSPMHCNQAEIHRARYTLNEF